MQQHYNLQFAAELVMFLRPPPVHLSERMNLNVSAENLIPVLHQREGWVNIILSSVASFMKYHN